MTKLRSEVSLVVCKLFLLHVVVSSVMRVNSLSCYIVLCDDSYFLNVRDDSDFLMYVKLNPFPICYEYIQQTNKLSTQCYLIQRLPYLKHFTGQSQITTQGLCLLILK